MSFDGTWLEGYSGRTLTDLFPSATYAIAVNGNFESVFGTSCSTPVTAAFITAINDARLAVGKSPVGFINPTVR